MDIVIHRSDDHIGQVVYDDRGERIYDTPTAVERIKKVIQRAIQKARHYEEVTGRSIDNVHLVLGGDTVTNENIYDHQPYNIDNTLDKQIEIAVQVYHECLLSLSREFESIHVVCQGGNHGDIRASGSSKKANADDIAYAMLDFSARVDDELDNVHFTRNDSTNYTNFMLRGHRAHIRHGDDCRLHIGTSSPQSDWRGWKLDHEFDIAYRGHYHEWRMEHVRDAPILMSGSLCPVGEYEESLSVRSQPVATIHGVTDETPMAWVEPISFS